jgi:hypothetical protein
VVFGSWTSPPTEVGVQEHAGIVQGNGKAETSDTGEDACFYVEGSATCFVPAGEVCTGMKLGLSECVTAALEESALGNTANFGSTCSCLRSESMDISTSNQKRGSQYAAFLFGRPAPFSNQN